MQFLRVVSFVAAFLTLGTLAAATPMPAKAGAALARRDVDTNVLDILNGVNVNIAPVVSNIKALSADDTQVTAYITDLVNIITDAQTAVTALDAKKVKRDDPVEDIAVVLAEIIEAVGFVLAPIEASVLPEVSILLLEVDSALKVLLGEVEFLVAGVVVDVSAILATVTGLVATLGVVLAGTLASLGL